MRFPLHYESTKVAADLPLVKEPILVGPAGFDSAFGLGGPGGNRTHVILVRSQVDYPLDYGTIKLQNWSGTPDLNRD